MSEKHEDVCPLCEAAGLQSPKPRWEWLGGTRGKDSWSAMVIDGHFVNGEKHPRVETRRWKDA